MLAVLAHRNLHISGVSDLGTKSNNCLPKKTEVQISSVKHCSGITFYGKRIKKILFKRIELCL